jgi:hypothetical protein
MGVTTAYRTSSRPMAIRVSRVSPQLIAFSLLVSYFEKQHKLGYRHTSWLLFVGLIVHFCQ